MRCSRTNLNGGEREQEHVIGASEEGLQARANLKWRAGRGAYMGKMCHDYDIREQRREDRQGSRGGD